MVLPPPQTQEFTDRVLALEAECHGELEQTRQSMQEIALLLQKTNQEVEKLATRELQLSNRVRDMEMHLDNYGRQDIRDLYTASHEVQLRLFMMRSQAEQLQSRQEHVAEYQEKLRLLVDLLAIQQIGVPGTGGNGRTIRAVPVGEIGASDNTLELIEAQEEERHRVSLEIQDGPAQAFTNLMLQAEVCHRLIDRDVDEARTEIERLRSQISRSLQDARLIMFDLRPLILDDLGLTATIESYLHELTRREMIGESSMNDSNGENEITTTMQVALFRFTQIAVSAILAAGKPALLEVAVNVASREAVINVVACEVPGDRGSIETRLDSDHLARRLRMLKGQLTTEQRPNHGFSVEVVIPIPDEALLSTGD
ncbi:MAG: histidine kinase [Thermomicrobiales bacterium]